MNHLRSVISAAFAVGVVVLTAASPADAAEPCLAEVDPSALVGSPEAVYRRARDAFEAKRWLEAAAIFRHLAIEHPTHVVGPYAVQLALEATNLAGRDVALASACSARMESDLPAYQASYCGSGAPHAELCETLGKIERDLARLGVETLVRDADKARGSAQGEKFRQAGRAYLAIWTTVAKDCEASHAAKCARSDELLFNAARAFRSGGALTDALAARALLFDPKYHLEATELAKTALRDQADDHLTLFEVAAAAAYFEKFAQASPKDPGAPAALNDAAALYAALGDLPAMKKQIELLARAYGQKQPGRVATAKLAYARILDERGAYRDGEAWLKTARASIEEGGTPEERAIMLGLLGRALARQGKAKQADDVFASLARIPTEVLARDRPGEDEARKLRSLGLALTAIGEAKLHLADQKRALAMRLSVRKADSKSLLEKKAAVDDVEHGYAELLAITPAPPPGPVVAAGGRVARMRAQLWAQVTLAEGSEVAAPYLEQAKVANRRCLDLSQKFQRQDRGSRACAAWLERHFPREYPALVELFPPPTLTGTGAPRPPPPLDRDGQPHAAAGVPD